MVSNDKNASTLVGLLTGVIIVGVMVGVHALTHNGWLSFAAVLIIIFSIAGIQGGRK